MLGDLDRATDKGPNVARIKPGQLYTLLSRAKSRDKIKLLNFDENHVKMNRFCNEKARQEMERMRSERVFTWNHPLMEMSGNKICLFNIRSWRKHIGHFLSDKVYTNHSSLICLTETHVYDTADAQPFHHIEHYAEGWTDIHKQTIHHGLAICYNESKVNVIEVYETTHALEMLPVLVEIENERVLVVVVYRAPDPLGTFITNFITELNILPIREHRTLVVGDFNLDQMLPENEEKITPIITELNFHQRSHYSTHILGGILDLVFDNDKTQSVEWIPSPYSDHFVLLIQV